MGDDRESLHFQHINLDSSVSVKSPSHQIEEQQDPFLGCKQRILKVELYRWKEENDHLFKEEREPTSTKLDPFLECKNRVLKVKLYRLEEENEHFFENNLEPSVKQEPDFDNSATQSDNLQMKSEVEDEKPYLSIERLKSEPCFDDSTAHLENSQVKKSERCDDDEKSGLEILGPTEPCFDDSTPVRNPSQSFEDDKKTCLAKLKSKVKILDEELKEDSQSDDNLDVSDWTDSVQTDCTVLPNTFPISAANEQQSGSSLNPIHNARLMAKSKNISHVCGKCNKGYESTQLLKKHVLSKCGSVWPFICKICSRGFRSHYYFLIHKRLKCRKVEQFVCQKCNSQFSSKKRMVAHKNLKCGSSGLYTCKIGLCDRKFSKEFLLANHRLISHRKGSGCTEKSVKLKKSARSRSKRLPCSHCSKEFKSNRELCSHLKDQLCGGNCCKSCLKIFPSESALELHIDSKMCGTNDNFICSVCSSGFLNKEGFKLHISTKCTRSKTFHCVKCVMNFTNNCNLKAHLRRHSIVVKPVSCSQCSKEFPPGRLKLHEKTCGRKRVSWQCNECNEQFKNKTSLISHIRSKCDTLSIFSCNICHKSFRQKHYLTQHIETKCNSVKPFVCKVCGHMFSFKQSLSEHEATQCGTLKMFLCNLCGKQYHGREQLENHTASKCGSFKPYECDKCKKRFYRRSNLKQHNDSVCGTKNLFKCNNCQKEFLYRNPLKVHIASKCVIYANNK